MIGLDGDLDDVDTNIDESDDEDDVLQLEDDLQMKDSNLNISDDEDEDSDAEDDHKGGFGNPEDDSASDLEFPEDVEGGEEESDDDEMEEEEEE